MSAPCRIVEGAFSDEGAENRASSVEGLQRKVRAGAVSSGARRDIGAAAEASAPRAP
jgi:hypothetical protein